ncbi:MAG: peptidoglycan editing factor PgeF [Alphaproteobacteria bacterium]|nr:peptidoglycan editing factor PgeF [Alphaproteobacteria bacterium]
MSTPHPPFHTSSLLRDTPHGFFGRKGGVSAGFFESLNAGFTVGDAPENVSENNARAALALGITPQNRIGLKQTHSDICHIIETANNWQPLEGDALATATKGIGLSVVTADCAPVLFAADGVIGAAHAGWGGALKGVLENTLAAMEKLGAQRSAIKAAIGPCIGPKSYEVSAGFELPFLADDEGSEKFFRPCTKPHKLMFDLPGYCAYRLARAGVGKVDIIGHDTLAMEDAYFSHRRTTLRGEPARGIQLSVISLT